MTSIEQLHTQLSDLTYTTNQLKVLLANDSTTSELLHQLERVNTTAAQITAIGPIASQPKIPGMYETWSELVLALVAAKQKPLETSEAATLERAITAVRSLRRKFNLAPGGA